MKHKHKHYVRNPYGIPGFLSEPPRRQPASIEEAIEIAKVEHMLWHANDDLGLFVFCAHLGAKKYLYPISAENEERAFSIALALHEGRGLPPADRWERVYPPKDAENDPLAL